jgi:hypothetical protein
MIFGIRKTCILKGFYKGKSTSMRFTDVNRWLCTGIGKQFEINDIQIGMTNFWPSDSSLKE